MASPILWPGGLAGTGWDLLSLTPAVFSAPVIWVNSVTGSDANAGTEPELPVKTSSAAVTAASVDSFIVYSANHAETISSTVTVNKAGIRFVSNGTGSARATFTPASGATTCFNVTAAGVAFENTYFKAAAATSGTGGRITVSATGFFMDSCSFDCGAFDQEGVLLQTGADQAFIENCVWTATGSRPTRGLGLTGTTNSDVTIDTCTFDGSTFGWAGNAVTVSNCVRLYIENLTLAGNADLFGTSCTSYSMVGLPGSSARKVNVS